MFFTECGLTLTNASGLIKSPGFPKNYYNHMDCTWLIQVPFGQSIEVNFLTFHLDNCNW